MIATVVASSEQSSAMTVAYVPMCGNAQLDAGEACDDGNPVQGDGCYDCQVEFPAADVLPATIIELPFSELIAQQSTDIPASTVVMYPPRPPANTDTGPAAISLMAAGAAAGYAWVRRRKK
jgi:cysteine-rich repeat protein